MNKNPFEILGLKVGFSIDAKLLQQRFIELSAANHPDRFVDPLDQADAADRASVINQARQILADPMKRAQALLDMLDPQPTQADQNALPPGFLMEVMEVREAIQEAQEAADAAGLAKVRDQAVSEQQERLSRLGALLDAAASGPADTAQSKRLADARLELNALRYIDRMIQGIDRKPQ
jgi:molecular chaperone HscB